MKRNRLLSCLLALALALLPLGAFALTDMTGRTVALPKPAQRVVALAAADCEIIAALNPDALVARGEYCDFPDSVGSLPALTSGAQTNLEAILALEPDLVVMSMMAQTVEQVDALTTGGAPVLVTNAQNIEGVYEDIRLLGEALGKTEAAEEMVADMRDNFAQIAADAPKTDEKRTVYFEVSPLEWGLWTAGDGTFMSEICTLLNLENAFADVTGWAEISEEQVLARDPDFIVTTAMYGGQGESPEAEIAGRPGWDSLKAVKNGCVLRIDSDEITRPGPRLVSAARALAAFVTEHP